MRDPPSGSEPRVPRRGPRRSTSCRQRNHLRPIKGLSVSAARACYMYPKTSDCARAQSTRSTYLRGKGCSEGPIPGYIPRGVSLECRFELPRSRIMAVLRVFAFSFVRTRSVETKKDLGLIKSREADTLLPLHTLSRFLCTAEHARAAAHARRDGPHEGVLAPRASPRLFSAVR